MREQAQEHREGNRSERRRCGPASCRVRAKLGLLRSRRWSGAEFQCCLRAGRVSPLSRSTKPGNEIMLPAQWVRFPVVARSSRSGAGTPTGGMAAGAHDLGLVGHTFTVGAAILRFVGRHAGAGGVCAFLGCVGHGRSSSALLERDTPVRWRLQGKGWTAGRDIRTVVTGCSVTSYGEN